MINTLFFYYFGLCLCVCSADWSNSVVMLKDESQNSSESMNGLFREVVKKYYCYADDVRGERTILYGAKSWTFPMQDVNLTLTYPSTDPENYAEEDKYMITGVLVMLNIDGSQSSGYVTSGGLFSNEISMTFMIKSITRLTYQFWLYGVKEATVNIAEFSSKQIQC